MTYPVGPDAVQAEVVLYYQTTTREYVEFLRDENTTTAAGNILFDLWNDHGQAAPVIMARLLADTNVAAVARCQKSVARAEAAYRKRHYKEWSRCYEKRAQGLSCDTLTRDTRIAAAAEALRDRIGGTKDSLCAGKGFTPGSLGHGSVCPAPCAQIVLFEMSDVASCAQCLADKLDGAAFGAAYGVSPPTLPASVPADSRACVKSLDDAAELLAERWTRALGGCEQDNASERNAPAIDCSTDPGGRIARGKAQAASRVRRCADLSGLAGCATSGSAPAVSACMEAAVGAEVLPYTEVAYP